MRFGLEHVGEKRIVPEKTEESNLSDDDLVCPPPWRLPQYSEPPGAWSIGGRVRFIPGQHARVPRKPHAGDARKRHTREEHARAHARGRTGTQTSSPPRRGCPRNEGNTNVLAEDSLARNKSDVNTPRGGRNKKTTTVAGLVVEGGFKDKMFTWRILRQNYRCTSLVGGSAPGE